MPTYSSTSTQYNLPSTNQSGSQYQQPSTAPTASAPPKPPSQTVAPTSAQPSSSTSTAGAPAPQQAFTGSPVTANGKIAPQTTSPAPVVPQGTPAPAPTGQVGAGSGVQDLNYPFPPYAVPDPYAGEVNQMNLLQYLFQNPFSLNDQVVNQMKAGQRESALMMADQAMEQGLQGVAGRGFSMHGGQAQAVQDNARQAAIQNILGGYRDIDMQKALQDRQDLMGVLGAGNDVLSGQQGRNLNAAQFALQRALGLGGLDLERNRLAESGRQFNMGNQLGWADLMNQMVMGRAGYGLNLAQLQQQAQNGMFGGLFGF